MIGSYSSGCLWLIVDCRYGPKSFGLVSGVSLSSGPFGARRTLLTGTESRPLTWPEPPWISGWTLALFTLTHDSCCSWWHWLNPWFTCQSQHPPWIWDRWWLRWLQSTLPEPGTFFATPVKWPQPPDIWLLLGTLSEPRTNVVTPRLSMDQTQGTKSLTLLNRLNYNRDWAFWSYIRFETWWLTNKTQLNLSPIFYSSSRASSLSLFYTLYKWLRIISSSIVTIPLTYPHQGLLSWTSTSQQ